MKSFVVHLLIAGIWLLLGTEPSFGRFVMGVLMGFLVLSLFQSLLGSGDYVRRVTAFVRFALVFAREFIAANASMVTTVLLKSRYDLRPNFVHYGVDGLRPLEILLLSYCISLTPGSTTVRVSDDFKSLTLHALDAGDPEALRARIDRVLKTGILAFTR